MSVRPPPPLPSPSHSEGADRAKEGADGLREGADRATEGADRVKEGSDRAREGVDRSRGASGLPRDERHSPPSLLFAEDDGLLSIPQVVTSDFMGNVCYSEVEPEKVNTEVAKEKCSLIASSFKIEEAIKVADLFHDRLDDWTTFTPKQADKDIRKRGAQRTVRKIIKCTLEPSPVFAPTPEESEEWSKHIDMYTVTIQSRSFLYNQVLPVDGLYLKSVEYSPEDVPPFTAEEETSELEGFDEQEIELWRRPLVSPLSQELSQTMDAAEEEELYPKDLMKRSADSEPPKFNILSILRILGKRRKRRSFPLSVSRESSGCMTRYAVVFSYIGTYLRGVQKMVSDPVDMDSVQGIFEEALKNFQSKLPHSFNASSRTDQGVHAMYTVGHFDLLHPIDGKQYYAPFLMRFLNHYMEKNQRSLRIHRIVPVDEDFHARFSAKGRSYLYRFGVLHRPNDLGMISPMLEVGKCYIVNAPFDEDKAREICSLFHGRQGHWTMFKKPHQNKGNRGQMALVDGRVRTNRTVDSCTLEKAGPPMSLDGSWTDAMEMFNIKITARSFLYQQVRRMVGCILEAGTGRTTEEEVRGLLASTTFAPWPNHIQVAPADGLYLTNVEYDTLDLPEYDPKEDDLDYESIKKEPTDSATGVRQKG
ncbi:unnamed protein product [Cyprideis torosa]|uniref:Pseudouridine synthase I TruA alpha/beta domain-containing protein n=1 Tax=Cyprideis torosa TaxID=163714 RepID=A0A7R8ZJF0_9CRUS|nr:unnamed protein product [Cyprideis torosa]CAG0882138.1 unnamed protein product [Cyprideis torosa]